MLIEDNLFFTEIEDSLILGVDEAGRGPLAGPVYASAVILPKDFDFSILNDSKKLTEKRRYEIEPIIKEKAIAWAVGFATHKEIDSLNILQATFLAMKRAVSQISPSLYEAILIDGNRTPNFENCTKYIEAIVKGDAKVPAIMAASILAKTQRDRIMNLCDIKWPEYNYKKHKGYPTKAHIEAVKIHGPSPIQRLSFNY